MANCSTASHEQIEMLLEFLQEHRDLARGFVRSVEGRARSRRLWDQITAQLNSLGGAVKTATQWQKVWADKKYLAKSKAARRNSAARGTGGGPPTGLPPSEIEEKVLDIMGEGFGTPQTFATIPAFLEENSENIPPLNSPTEVGLEVDVMEDHIYAQRRASTATSTASASAFLARSTTNTPVRSAPSSQARQPRWRSQRQQMDVRTRLLDGEAAKLAELAAIRRELAKLTQVVGALLEEYKK